MAYKGTEHMAKPRRTAQTLIGASVGYGDLLTSIPTVDDVLNDHATALRHDFIGYRNHVYRIVNLCVAIVGRRELEKIAVAAVFHDLGIWTNGTFDYIAPSIALAHEHLLARARGRAWGLDRRDRRDDRGPPQDHAGGGRSGFADRGIPASRLD